MIAERAADLIRLKQHEASSHHSLEYDNSDYADQQDDYVLRRNSFDYENNIMQHNFGDYSETSHWWSNKSESKSR